MLKINVRALLVDLYRDAGKAPPLGLSTSEDEKTLHIFQPSAPALDTEKKPLEKSSGENLDCESKETV